jgi:hypothetical protein
VLKGAYAEICQQNLKLYGVSTRILKDFVNTERDVLRGITRMPTSEYRLWKENILEEIMDPESTKDNFEP